jgi:hypothetical protein
MVTKNKQIYYDMLKKVKSKLLKRGETLVPFNCFQEKIDWNEVGKWMKENIPDWVFEMEWDCNDISV